ncbi:MAG TPA: AbrB/MazE/SpoVT family DNA-binding domain-containing protein [Burkholderiaceae bacterium]|jgi:antitoxin VapB|nr:AbrB/MazE/SpoVT family DNA-binding domain-containing protein [Burkholderiaceae bacterium]
MDTAKIFKTGRSRAVRLPKEYRFEGNEVTSESPATPLCCCQKSDWSALLASLELFEPGFRIERAQPQEQQRRPLLDRLAGGQ